MELVDLQAQYARYRREIEARLAAVFAHARFIQGPEVQELEAELSRFVGVPHCIAVGSGTQALELALRALGVGPGDEVVTVPFTWVSTAEAIALVGATPVFVDIEPRGFCMDPERLEAALGPRTKAILPVSLFGQMPDFDAIAAIAEPRGIPVIEDGAQSFGATQRARRSSGVSLMGCTSFFPSKPLGCYGDGGALFTSDANLAARLRALRAHGATEHGVHRELGTNARLDTLQAAVLLAKLPHFEQELARRAAIADHYNRAFAELLETPAVLAENTHVFAQYTLRVAERERFAAGLAERGIPTAVHYARCLHQQPAYARLARFGALPQAERAAREVLSLPLHAFLSESEQERVVAAVRSLAERQRLRG